MTPSLTLASIDSTADEAHSRALFSRSAGLLSQSGNADSELKTRVSDEVADDFRKLARSLGMNTSELMRLLVLTRVYGLDGVSRMTESAIVRAAGVVPEKGQERKPEIARPGSDFMA